MADLHVSYYAGHEGRFGHELVEFSVHTHPQCRYASLTYTNRSNYRKDEDITKRFHVSLAVVDELRRMVTQSEVLKQSDACWPKKNRDGKQTLTVQMDGETVTLTVSGPAYPIDIQLTPTDSKDPLAQ